LRGTFPIALCPFGQLVYATREVLAELGLSALEAALPSVEQLEAELRRGDEQPDER